MNARPSDAARLTGLLVCVRAACVNAGAIQNRHCRTHEKSSSSPLCPCVHAYKRARNGRRCALLCSARRDIRGNRGRGARAESYSGSEDGHLDAPGHRGHGQLPNRTVINCTAAGFPGAPRGASATPTMLWRPQHRSGCCIARWSERWPCQGHRTSRTCWKLRGAEHRSSSIFSMTTGARPESCSGAYDGCAMATDR